MREETHRKNRIHLLNIEHKKHIPGTCNTRQTIQFLLFFLLNFDYLINDMQNDDGNETDVFKTIQIKQSPMKHYYLYAD